MACRITQMQPRRWTHADKLQLQNNQFCLRARLKPMPAGASSVIFFYAAIGFCSQFAKKLPSALALIIFCRPARYNLCCLLCCCRDVGTICSHSDPTVGPRLSLNPCSASYIRCKFAASTSFYAGRDVVFRPVLLKVSILNTFSGQTNQRI